MKSTQMNAERAGRSSLSAFIRAPSAFICVFTAFCITSSGAAPISLTDDLGRTVELKAPAQRIVTLAPFLTELAFAAGAGAQVVGVSAYSDFPPEAKRLPQVASAAGFSMEQIAALHPDLALVWKDSFRPEDVERIARFGAVVYVAQARRLEEVPRVLEAIGRLSGHDTAPLAAHYESELARLRGEYASRRRLDAFVEIWHRPLQTVSGHHFINDALEICGARNIFEDLPGVAPNISWEAVYSRDPEVVIGAGSAGDRAQFEANWRERPTLAAVRNARLIYVDPDKIERPSLRIVEGVAELCAALDRARR